MKNSWLLKWKRKKSKMPILIPTPSSDYYDGLKRPTYSALCSKKYIQEFKVCETDWRDSLKNITVKL